MVIYNSEYADVNNTVIKILKRDATKILVSDKDLSYILMINGWGPGQGVIILGIIVNSLNVMTFVKQGVRDSVNISLLGLTISDLGSLVFLFFANLCFTPSIMKMDLPFYPHQIIYLFTWVHLVFTRVTTGTTAWIGFERCLCIVAPLKIKSIITPKRTMVHFFVLYAIMIAAVAPIFYTSRPTWITDPVRNKSILGLVKITNRGNIEGVAFFANNSLPLCFFVFIVACTAVLVKTLQSKAKWRKQASFVKLDKDKSTRDTKVAKMVLIISIEFIICYAPAAFFFICIIVDPELKIDGAKRNVLIAVFAVLFHLESINATTNFFIYIKMSSKFRSTFKQMFSLSWLSEPSSRKIS